ncbi:hypothetical protein ARMGADRAFT_1067043 [Armillaria gallica]|uniref:Uncharacterized protein n=1 Tax=Armillaria gallica TaxID=47427 RepID=A0A2H3D3M1_ARMGA|nr:hypothetical protein ARMGADRAFT_1067043 [Armillaria gallica]
MGAEGRLVVFTPDSSSADFDYEEPFHSCVLYYHAHDPILPIDPDVENASKPDHSDVDASPFGTSIIEDSLAEMLPSFGYGILVITIAICGSPKRGHRTIIKTTDAIPRMAPDDARWILYVFDELTAKDPEHNVVPAGQAIHLSEDRNTWPPHCIFAAVYASVLLTSRSAQDFLTQVISIHPSPIV